MGHPDFQHLVRYPKTQIVWYAMVSNIQHDAICLPVLQARETFSKFGLPMCKLLFEKKVHTWAELHRELRDQFAKTAEGPIEEYNEGQVVYIEQQGKSKEVISLFKLKNLEYRLFRKMREKLSNFNQKYDSFLKA